jgi:hypothetical protein
LRVVVDRRDQVQQVVLELREVLEDVRSAGMEEVDDPHVVVRIDQDVGRVQIAVHERHVVVVLHGKRGSREELLVEAADIRQLEAARKLED